MDAGADGSLVSRIMVTSFTSEIEVCGDCAVGYGDLRPLARDGVAVTAGDTTGNCLKQSRDIWIGNLHVASRT
jgi:hypothetical protein